MKKLQLKLDISSSSTKYNARPKKIVNLSSDSSSKSSYYTPSSVKKLPEGYELIKELGQGAFGSVVKAYDKKREKFVAIKLQKFEEHDKVFKKEIENLKKISNDCENLVCIIDYGLFYKKHYIVMDFIDGMRLDKYIEENPNEITYLFQQLVKATKKLHSKGFAHMDIKPENIMVDSNSKLHLVDLGLACFDNNEVCEGGTKKYLAPDMAFGDYSVKERQKADVWAIGLSLAKILKEEKYAKKRFELIQKDEDVSLIIVEQNYEKSLQKVLELLSPKKERMKLFKTL